MKRQAHSDQTRSEQDRFHQGMLAGLAKGANSAHPDAEQLAAFAEQVLGSGERASVLNHLAGCAACRDVLYSFGEDAVPAAIPVAREWLSKWRWFVTPALAAATFSIVFFMHRDEPRPRSEEEIRPVIASAPPKPFIEPAAPVTREKTNRRVAAELPAPPAISAAKPLFRPMTIASKINPSLPPNRFMLRGNSLLRSASSIPTVNVASGFTGEHWGIDAAGQLQKRSIQGLFNPVSVDGTTRFTAVANIESQVWAARADAKLYHSDDGGLSWRPMVVQDEQGGLAAPITSLRVLSLTSVEVRTASGERWITEDEGQHWRRQP